MYLQGILLLDFFRIRKPAIPDSLLVEFFDGQNREVFVSLAEDFFLDGVPEIVYINDQCRSLNTIIRKCFLASWWRSVSTASTFSSRLRAEEAEVVLRFSPSAFSYEPKCPFPLQKSLSRLQPSSSSSWWDSSRSPERFPHRCWAIWERLSFRSVWPRVLSVLCTSGFSPLDSRCTAPEFVLTIEFRENSLNLW